MAYSYGSPVGRLGGVWGQPAAAGNSGMQSMQAAQQMQNSPIQQGNMAYQPASGNAWNVGGPGLQSLGQIGQQVQQGNMATMQAAQQLQNSPSAGASMQAAQQMQNAPSMASMSPSAGASMQAAQQMQNAPSAAYRPAAQQMQQQGPSAWMGLMDQGQRASQAFAGLGQAGAQIAGQQDQMQRQADLARAAALRGTRTPTGMMGQLGSMPQTAPAQNPFANMLQSVGAASKARGWGADQNGNFFANPSAAQDPQWQKMMQGMGGNTAGAPSWAQGQGQQMARRF